jgi:hypothetical protein
MLPPLTRSASVLHFAASMPPLRMSLPWAVTTSRQQRTRVKIGQVEAEYGHGHPLQKVKRVAYRINAARTDRRGAPSVANVPKTIRGTCGLSTLSMCSRKRRRSTARFTYLHVRPFQNKAGTSKVGSSHHVGVEPPHGIGSKGRHRAADTNL